MRRAARPQPGRWLLLSLVLLTAGCLGPDPAPSDACPTNVTAHADDAGDVELDWDAVPNATSYPVYRRSGDEGFTRIANVTSPTTHYTDASAPAVDGLAYRVHAASPTGESSGCPTVSLSTIPVFPTLARLAGAAVLGLVAYLALAPRRGP